MSTYENLLSQQEYANTLALALALFEDGMIEADPTTGGYVKKVALYRIDALGETCSCPDDEKRKELQARITQIETEILLADTDRERTAKTRALNNIRRHGGPNCKHIYAAMAQAGLIDLRQELRTFPVAIQKAAKLFFDRQHQANLDQLESNDPHPTTATVVHTYQRSAPPLMVEVIKVQGKRDVRAVDKRAFVWAVSEDKPLVTVQYFQMDTLIVKTTLEDGTEVEKEEFDIDGSLLKAMERWPEEHYSITRCRVQAAAATRYATL